MEIEPARRSRPLPSSWPRERLAAVMEASQKLSFEAAARECHGDAELQRPRGALLLALYAVSPEQGSALPFIAAAVHLAPHAGQGDLSSCPSLFRSTPGATKVDEPLAGSPFGTCAVCGVVCG